MPATHETQHDGEDVTKASTARNRSHGELDDRGSTSLNGAANRPQRPRSTPSSPSGETAGFNTPNITTITEDDVTPREPSEANSIEQCDQQGGEEAVSISREESRSPPLDQQPAEGCRSEHHALPRGQQLKDLRSSEPAPTTTRSALADSRCETNAQPSGSGAPSPKQTRASQATREQRNKRSNILHAQVVPAGVSKRPKQKKAQHGNKNIVTTSEPDPSVYLEIFLYKQRERTQNAVRKAYEERDIALQQQQELMATNAALGQELDSAYEEKQGLQLAHQAREVEMRKLKEISSKHKKFIDGLSNDLNSVKAKFGEKQEKAVEANRSLQDEREGLLRTLNECAERASQQRNVALEACSETQIQLQAAILRADYLDQQLSEKVGLLAEERDRRAQLERRMLSASDSSDADRALIKKGQDALLDKLFLIDATLESNSADSQTSQLLSQVLEAVQTISTQTKTSADDATVTKGLVEALGDRSVCCVSE